MEEHQTILGIGGAATTKVVDFKAGRLKSAFNAKDLTTYLDDIDTYIEKRALLLEEAYGKGEEFSSCESQSYGGGNQMSEIRVRSIQAGLQGHCRL